MNVVPPPDEIAHQDGVLMAEVTRVNRLLGLYVVDFLDADARRSLLVAPAKERELAERVAALAVELHRRADRRERHGDPRPLLGSPDGHEQG